MGKVLSIISRCCRHANYVCTIFFLLIPYILCAQQETINGTVADSSGLYLNGATVSLLNEQNLVINYTSTNSYGSFKLPHSDNGVWINISYIGFKNKKIKLEASKRFYQVRLIPDATTLENVVVKNRPATELRGDTLSFNVRSFATKEDRTIADVLKRLPGLEVTVNGSIYFNGKKIENLYIEGDDLMDGRYGMATKVIKKELIKSVDVINHHQPIAVIKDKVLTDKIAVNLVLEDENSLKLSASSQSGVGLPPQLEASVAPIILSKKLKMVSLAGYNNAGIDYKNEVKQLGASNFIDDISVNRKDIALSLSSTSPPDMPLNYYYFNRSTIFSLNTLYKNKANVQFKWNSNVFFDRNQFDYEGKMLSYLADDTITYTDSQSIINKPLLLNIGLNIMINNSRYFLNNSLKASVQKEDISGLIAFNDNSFSQILNKKWKEFSNDFNWIPGLRKKGIAEIRWHSSYGTNWQELNLNREYYFDIGPQNGYYDIVKQQLQSPGWYNVIYLGYSLPSKIINQEYRIGYRSLQQELCSNLTLTNTGISAPYSNDKGNDAIFRTNNIYILAHYQVKLQKFKSDIQLPLSLQQIKSTQPFYSLQEKRRNLFLLPSLSFTYNFDNEKYLQATYKLQNTFGDIATAYKGAILLNYRSLQAYAQGFQQEKTHRANIMYSYQKSIKLFYSHIGLSYDYKVASSILVDSFSNNVHRSVFIPYINSQTAFTLYGGASQYLFKFKTKLGIKMQEQRAFSEQFVNNTLLRFRFDNIFLNASIDKNFEKIIDVNYYANFSWTKMRLADKINLQFPQTKSYSFDQKAKISFNFFKHYYISTTGTHRINKLDAFNNIDYFFLDANIKRLGIIKGMDLELNCYNLLNVKDYTIYLQSRNLVSTSNYQTRGISFFLKVNYSF